MNVIMTMEQFKELRKKASDNAPNTSKEPSTDTIHRILKVCYPNIEQMWASQIVAVILGCEFRDSEYELRRYLEEL